jgi:hypothetical protein
MAGSNQSKLSSLLVSFIDEGKRRNEEINRDISCMENEISIIQDSNFYRIWQRFSSMRRKFT